MSAKPFEEIRRRAEIGLEPSADETLALLGEVDRLREMLDELLDAAEGVQVYPEGAFGFDDLDSAISKGRTVLG